jgi:hypothetical protein
MNSSQSISGTERFDLVIAGEVNKARRIYYSQGICNLASYSMKDLRGRHIEELRATSQPDLDEFSAHDKLRPLLIPLLAKTLNGETFQNKYLKNVHEKISDIFNLSQSVLDHQKNNRDKIDLAACYDGVSLSPLRKIYQEYLGEDFHRAVVDEHGTMLASDSVLGEFVDESWDSQIKPKFICEQFIFPFLKGDEEGSNHSEFRKELIDLVKTGVTQDKPLIVVIAEVVKAIEIQDLFLEKQDKGKIVKQFDEGVPTNSGVGIFWSKSGLDFLNVATTPLTLTEEIGRNGMARCNVYDVLIKWLPSQTQINFDVSGSVMPLLKRLDTLNNFGLYHQTLITKIGPAPCEKQEEEKAGEGAWCTGLTEEQKNSICDQLQSKLDEGDKGDAGHEECKGGEVDAERMIIDLCKKSEQYKIYFGFSFVQNNYSQWLTSYAPWQGIENIDGLAELAELVEQYYCDCHTLNSNERIEKLGDMSEMIALRESGFPDGFNANVLTLLKNSLAEELGYLDYRASLDPPSLLGYNIDGPRVSRKANDQELISEWYKPQLSLLEELQLVLNEYLNKHNPDSLIQSFFHANIDTAQQINQQLNDHVDSGELGLIKMIEFYKQICDLKDQAHSRSSMNSLRERVGARQESRWLPHKEGSELARGLNNISPAWVACIQSRVKTLNTALSMMPALPALPDRPLKCAVDLETFMQEGEGVNNTQLILNDLFNYINPNVASDCNKDENCNKHEIRLIIYPLLSNDQKMELQPAFIDNPRPPKGRTMSTNSDGTMGLLVSNENSLFSPPTCPPSVERGLLRSSPPSLGEC